MMQQFNLGMMYMHGRNVQRDPVEGIKWLRKAADQGDVGAQNNIGNYLMQEWGAGVKQDYAEAYFWYSLAAKAKYHNSAKEAAKHLTREQIKTIKKRVREWKPVVTPVPKPAPPAKAKKVRKTPCTYQSDEFDPISEVIDKRLTVSKETIRQLTAFKKARKFVDLPGVNIAAEKKRLSAVLNKLTDKLIGGIRRNPTKLWVLKQFQVALVGTCEEDTEAQEHFGVELEKLMDILGIKSSDGLVGYYRYGDLVYAMKKTEK